MRFAVVAVGRARRGPEQAIWETYARRLRTPLDLHEVELRHAVAVGERPAREGLLLASRVPAGARRCALDASGRPLTSEAFAAAIGRWRDEGVPAVAFLIGGADGLDPALRGSADLTLSLGAMTWPHLLVRAMLAEQLYRAETILAGHPYHRA